MVLHFEFCFCTLFTHFTVSPQIVSAVHYCHQKNIVHRDLKVKLKCTVIAACTFEDIFEEICCLFFPLFTNAIAKVKHSCTLLL